ANLSPWYPRKSTSAVTWLTQFAFVQHRNTSRRATTSRHLTTISRNPSDQPSALPLRAAFCTLCTFCTGTFKVEPHPKTYSGDLADPPAALNSLCLRDQWVVWKWMRGKDGKGWTKPPYCAENPTRHAANNDARTWSAHRAAVEAVLAGSAHGIGFVLTGTNIAAA